MANLTLSSADADLFAALTGELFTAVVGDVLDAMGHRHQFLPAGIASLAPKSKIVGRAMPVLEADVYSDVAADGAGPLARKPFGLMLEALDDLKPGEIYIATGVSIRRCAGCATRKSPCAPRRAISTRANTAAPRPTPMRSFAAC